LMLFCAGNIVDDDVTVNRICGLQSAVCKCHTPVFGKTGPLHGLTHSGEFLPYLSSENYTR